MTECDERRVPGIKRVNVATLVEICGNQPGVPAFEAQSLDVSGRGMHVRTGYVPNVGDPLVCRFENLGQEIVVEGVVAWRREGEQGGDFGIEFTALDSSSVDALRALCGVPLVSAVEPESGANEYPLSQPEACASGAKVKLHIDGLGSPMKASVRDTSRRRLKVGSQLQFLQVGRHLEIEDVGVGVRRNARIDSVDVRVDPRTQVPELVVALRYEGLEDSTPEPSVVDQSSRDPSPCPARAVKIPAAAQSSGAASTADPDDAEACEAEAEMVAEQQAAEQARAAYHRLGEAAQGAAQLAKATSNTLARFGQAAASGAGSLLRGAGKQLSELRKQPSAPTLKRQTASPPMGARSLQTAKLRPQGGVPGRSVAPGPSQTSGRTNHAAEAAPVAATSANKQRSNRLALAAAGIVIIGATAAYAMRDVDGPVAAVPLAASVNAPAPQLAPAAKPQRSGDSKGGIVADVPLFGPTPMATMEPAPLEPATDPQDEEALERAAAAAAVDDATWSDGAGSQGAANPADVKPWGRGSMHLPTIHKLRLDAPGGAISGAVSATGFTVVIPGRKVMESGRAIQRRDKRIVEVKTSNTAKGAQVSFQFRDKVPAYRVRLRHDFAEFLVSAPQN